MTDSLQKIRVIEYGVRDAYQNMALDQHLLLLCEQGCEHGFLRFYGWRQSALSLGRFEPVDVIDLDRARDDGVQVVRRPTGGRVVMHGDDLTYAIIVPKHEGHNLAETYRTISMCIIKGFEAMGLSLSLNRGSGRNGGSAGSPCFGSVSRYEITWRDRKLVGSAQRVGRQAVLQHGSIPIGHGYLDVADYIGGDMRSRAGMRGAMAASTCCLADAMTVGADALSIGRTLMEGFRSHFVVDEHVVDQQSFDQDLGPLALTLKHAVFAPET